MSSVDDRIVNMQFNNKQFTQGVTESQKSLNDLEKTLTNTAKSKGLGNLASQVEGATGKFSAMKIAGVSAIATIASKATAMGLNLVKSLTISPIMDGFREYQTNLTSIQTIIANTGKKLPIVEKALNKLNDYSDQTIYNFGQMAAAIGKFTAAGVKLGPATDAIRGMANTAALTGASAEDLNRAMYQMSQALSAGTIRLMDWKSVENANMGTSNVRKAIMATAASMDDQGKSMDAALKKHGNFRASLAEGWLSADIFNKTMKVMGGRFNKTTQEVEAYSVAQLKAMGYTDQQAKEMHKLSKSALQSATVIKTFPQMMSVIRESIGSMWSKIFSGVIGNFKESKKLWTGVGNSIIDQIDAIGDAAGTMLKNWRKFGGRDAVLEGLKTGFKALGAIMGTVKLAFRDVFPPGSEQGLANMSKSFRDFMENFTPSAKTLESMRKIFGGVFAVLHIGVTIVKALAAGFSAFLGPLFESTKKGQGGILSFAGSIGEMLMKLDKFLTSGGKMTDLFTEIGKAGGEMAAKGIEIATGVIDGIISGFSISGGKIKSVVTSIGTNIIDWIKGVLGIHSPAAELVPVGINIVEGIAQGIQGAVSFIFESIGMIVGAIFGGFKQAFGQMNALDIAAAMNALLTGGLLVAIIRMSNSFTSFSNSISHSLTSVGDAIREFSGVETYADKILKVGIALGILAVSIAVLSRIDPKKMAYAIGALSVMLGEMTIALSTLAKIEKKEGTASLATVAASMVAMSTAMLILSGAVAILGNMDMTTLSKGLGAIAIAMGIMIGALVAFSKFGGVIKGAAGSMVLMAIAMNILATAVLAFGMMDLTTLGKGFGSMAIGLGLMVGALILVAKASKTAPAAAGAMVAMAGSMVILSIAVAAFGNMNMKTLAKGFGAVAVGLGLFVGALVILGANIGGTVVAAGAMLSMATAMAILIPTILALGQADMSTLAKGLGAMAIALGLFVAGLIILGVVATYTGPALLMLGGAMALAGIGMLAFGTGFALLAASGVAGVAVLTAAISAFIMLLPNIAIQMAAAFVVFIEAIAAAAPRIADAFGTIFSEMLRTVTEAIPEILELVRTLLQGVLQLLIDIIPDVGRVIQTLVDTLIDTVVSNTDNLFDAGWQIIRDILQGIDDNIGEVIDRGGDIVIKIIEGLGSKATDIAWAMGATIYKFLVELDKAIVFWTPMIVRKGKDIAGHLVQGVVDGMLGGETRSKIQAAAKGLAQITENALTGPLSFIINSPSKRMMPIGRSVGEGVAVGINQSVGLAVAAAISLANAVVSAGFESVAALQRTARSAQGAADRALAKAEATAAAAKKLEKKNPKLAKKLNKRADRERAAADIAQERADAAAEAVSSAREFEEADFKGKGDIRADQAVEFAASASRMLARANAEAVQARELMKKNKKAGRAMLVQAQKDAREAKRLADLAIQSQREANANYAKEVDLRVKALEDEEKARQEEKIFEAADTQGKLDILRLRAETEQAKADAAYKSAKALIDQAKAMAATDAAGALKILDAAEEAAAEAKRAEEAAETARSEAERLSGSGGGATGGSSGGPLQPSRSVLEDAASVVDRYTASLAAAQAAAAATETVLQFNQYNTSPEALSASEIYRQTNNLLSAQEIKMGVNSSPSPN